MSIKQNLLGMAFPLVAGGLIVFGIWFGLGGGEPAEEVQASVIRHVTKSFQERGSKEGSDFTVGHVEILSLDKIRAVTKTEVRILEEQLYHEVLRVGRSWTVTRDLAEDFLEQCKEETTKERVAQRLMARVQERYRNIPLEGIKPGEYKSDFKVSVEQNKVVGVWSFPFTYRMNNEIVKSAQYFETFTFEQGTWELQGQYGRLLERAR